MELVKINNHSEDRHLLYFFPQFEFVLIDRGVELCQLMAIETSKGQKLDLTVITLPKYRRQGYATYGLKLLIEWAIKNNYKTVTLTNLFEFQAIDKIAKRLNFDKKPNCWIRSITGRHF